MTCDRTIPTGALLSVLARAQEKTLGFNGGVRGCGRGSVYKSMEMTRDPAL